METRHDVPRGKDRMLHLRGTGLYQVAMRKARYGHRDWVVWSDREGVQHAAVKSPEVVKQCLLDCGTRGNWSLILSGGMPLKGFWWLGINLLAQMKRGMY